MPLIDVLACWFLSYKGGATEYDYPGIQRSNKQNR